MSAKSKEVEDGGSALGVAWLLARLALQNLLRRPTRTLMLLVAVALGTGAVFASFVVGRGIEASVDESFARMGADLIVVPKETMVNITSALLTVQPTEASIDSRIVAEIKGMDGVAQAAPQTIYSVSTMPDMPKCKSNLIAFDPKNDFTVMPWVKDRLPRAFGQGDLIVGGRRGESVGEEIQPAGTPSVVYGKFGRSGVGPFDESIFATYDTVAGLARAAEGKPAAI
ncbi:MAG: ABC transporter permease, partial [Microbacteriaceae bacterium]|nr:ABC transporter permease [Microbacteriaceae bacterium]